MVKHKNDYLIFLLNNLHVVDNKRFIFIIGIQRSGTTILDNLFTRHKNTAFFEELSNIYYRQERKFHPFFYPWSFRWFWREYYIRSKFRKRLKGWRPDSVEGALWNKFYPEIAYLTEEHATKEITKYYYDAIEAELKAFKTSIFVNKNPANCLRLRWITTMFPLEKTRYILIWRDPRAVIYSIYQKMRRQWDWELQNEYEHHYKGYATVYQMFGNGKSKLEACINYYKYLNSCLQKDLPIINDHLIELQYENLIENTHDELKRLYDFTSLEWYDALNETIPPNLSLKENKKWETELSSEEKKLLESSLSQGRLP